MATDNLKSPTDVKSTSQLHQGMLAARDMCIAIENINKKAIEQVAEVEFSEVAALLKNGLEPDGEHREGFLLALAEFMSLALDGCVLIPDQWEPVCQTTEAQCQRCQMKGCK